MNIHNKDQFAEAFTNLGATSSPEQIRNLIDEDQYKELCKNERGEWYLLDCGQPVKVEG